MEVVQTKNSIHSSPLRVGCIRRRRGQCPPTHSRPACASCPMTTRSFGQLASSPRSSPPYRRTSPTTAPSRTRSPSPFFRWPPPPLPRRRRSRLYTRTLIITLSLDTLSTRRTRHLLFRGAPTRGGRSRSSTTRLRSGARRTFFCFSSLARAFAAPRRCARKSITYTTTIELDARR